MTIIMTGSSGLLGTALARALRGEGRRVLSLVRRPPRDPDEARWDPRTGALDPEVLRNAEAVIHLAGAGIGDRRWSDAYKAELRASRVTGTRTLARALGELGDDRPGVLLSASAIGFYGDTGDRAVDESAPRGTGFLADLVRDWEAEARVPGMRVVLLRSGIVLARGGGTLGKMLPIFRAGAGAPLGTGRQYFSWIGLPDWVGAVRFLLGPQAAGTEGPVNLTAPEPVTNAAFTKALGRALHRPTLPIPVPAFGLRLALGELADEGVLISQRIRPGVLTELGYPFLHPSVGPALEAVLA
ncbi:TIGR01777 family oxidoreductase [Rhizohabitans arisaemae]|uniref:TIGR01777 family oxidoreductase n=1 Tax=Rhizohabitans arisaemae TaxID=2720610 RepID=UPI0024B21735|nr:TIGR01777 family oxidoreductase [Rhizohabitans arisaemae]